jgi:thioredoxin reductase
MTTCIDPTSIAGKIAAPSESAEVLVIGAGPAGLSAALESARLGAQVTLVDENPLDPQLMALDVPLYFGGRMTGAAGHAGNVILQMHAADACFEEAVLAGVDVRLGVTAWGLYSNAGALQALPTPMVALADRTHSWMCGFGRLIVTTGARDLALALPGWVQPGVMGAVALRRLLTTYDAFAGRRIVILGSGPFALHTALLAHDKGIEVAAVAEALPQVQAEWELVDRVDAWQIPVLTGHIPIQIQGGALGVTGVRFQTPQHRTLEIECDSVCIAVGRIPAIELLDSASAQVVADSCRGGYVPSLNRWETSIKGVFVAGDCAGLTSSSGEAAEQGRDAARQALGEPTTETVQLTGDAWKYQAAWIRLLAEQADDSLVICQCEGVTRGDLLGLRAPAYLGPQTASAARQSLSKILCDGPLNQDQIKRLTRACMGVCQARRCREQVALMLAQTAGVFPDDVPLATYRPPVRPLSLATIAEDQEPEQMRKLWRPWFDIAGQLCPYEDIGTEREFVDLFGSDPEESDSR